MTTWIKLDKHVGNGEIWYSLPSENIKLELTDQIEINCRFSDGSMNNLLINFPYNEQRTTIEDGVPMTTLLRSPSVLNSNRMYIQLGDVEVDEEDVKKFKK